MVLGRDLAYRRLGELWRVPLGGVLVSGDLHGTGGHSEWGLGDLRPPRLRRQAVWAEDLAEVPAWPDGA